ncbi:MAG: Methyltransferase type 11 [Acidimicrobiales bacterium]|nr:Methyltransferase type 11 [Acidimicrobiales bacterium]
MTTRTAGRPIGLSPGAPEDAAGQDAKKYATGNPVVQRLLARWMAKLTGVLGTVGGTVVDVGVGEGLALERMLPAGHPAIGLEYRFDKVVAATDRLPALAGVRADAGMLPLADHRADLVTCIELLEHLPLVEPAVAELARVTRGRCVVSVPWEPWFRLGNLGRGKNVARFGNDPEHVQAFTPGRLRRALEAEFASVRVVRAFPWLIAEAANPIRRPDDARVQLSIGRQAVVEPTAAARAAGRTDALPDIVTAIGAAEGEDPPVAPDRSR